MWENVSVIPSILHTPENSVFYRELQFLSFPYVEKVAPDSPPPLSPWSALVGSERFDRHWLSAYITSAHQILPGDC